MSMAAVKVHCPNCHRKVDVAPSIRSVVHDAGVITVNFNTASAAHHCGAPPMRTGFHAPSKEGQP